ncbi:MULTISPECIES: M1 family metallopeptidase [Sphingomonas]|uniref:M1 family metallopeptidase n=1 Tax=Sphingomonas TaxID=13687 RepID=UPI000DEFD7CF|nr:MULTISPECIES: M1 family metallopeptidase [Sphingomonas]
MRSDRLLPLLLLGSALAGPAAFAQVPAPAQDRIESTVTQLPRTAIPRHYTVAVTPDAARLSFAGTVAIDLDVVKPTSSLTLNAKALRFQSVAIQPGSGGPVRPGRATVNAANETATLTFPGTLTPGRYRLTIAYTGTINQQATGLFALDSTAPDGTPRRSLFTQFEAADARAFVPSWDEPDYKTQWDLSAVVPNAQMAVGNMPIVATERLSGDMKRVTFATTPLMSSYLLFFATGDFGRISKKVDGTEVAITMSRGNESKARTALDAEGQVLTYYNRYFGTRYPLPKLENVAGPGQSQFFGAMENWGAIFTFERILLDDPAITTDAERQAIFGVQAHEMAHQWFGDLVTMAWWDDLWLNEGFASWMANKTEQHFHPEWGSDVSHVASREAALGIDALATTHPIVQQVRTVEQANQAFDTITYEKGESVIAMLEGFAGADVWQRGIQAYIAKHAYGNTRTDDLWSAVEGAGAPGLTRIAHDFTLQPGVPLIRVGPATCSGGATRATLTQDQYSEDRRGKLKPLSWHVPVRATTVGGPATALVTAGRTATLSTPGCGPLLVNAGQTGYYRTLYQPQQLAALTQAFGRLSAVDQYGLLNDNSALSRSGYLPVAPSLDLLAAVPANAQRKVTASALAKWLDLYGLFADQPSAQALVAAQIDRRFKPILDQIGMSPRDDEPVLDATLRPDLISALGKVGDPAVLAQSRRLFANPARIPGALRSTWLGVVAYGADAPTWERLHQLAQSTKGSVERTTYYQLLGSAKDEGLARRALALALTTEPGATVSAGMISAVARNHPELALDFALAHLTQVRALVDTSGWSRYLAQLGSGSDKPATIAKLNAYAAAHVAASDRKPIQQVTTRIRTRLGETARLRAGSLAWLTAHRR